MSGNDHWERTAFGSSDGMLELLNMVPNVERCTSSIHRIRGDRGESRVHYSFNTVKTITGHEIWRRLAIKTGCEELVQPRGENDDPHVAL